MSLWERLKVDQPQEVVTGNPTVIKMLVSFYRHARGQNALRDILGPVVREVLQDRTLGIRIDPVEIYKSWINQTESQTGHKRSVLHLVYELIHCILGAVFTCIMLSVNHVLVEFWYFVCLCYVCGVFTAHYHMRWVQSRHSVTQRCSSV